VGEVRRESLDAEVWLAGIHLSLVHPAQHHDLAWKIDPTVSSQIQILMLPTTRSACYSLRRHIQRVKFNVEKQKLL